jgi:hypothetical protein
VIQFNDWDERDGGRYPVHCGRDNYNQYLGPYGHPMVLYYQWKNGGLSFPLFHPSYGPHHRDRKDTLDLNYLQIYFAVHSSMILIELLISLALNALPEFRLKIIR